MINVLYLSSELNAVSGVSKHLYYLACELKKQQQVKTHFIVPGGDFLEPLRKETDYLSILPQLSHNKRSIYNFLYSIMYVAIYCIRHKIKIIHSHTHYCANIGWYAGNFIGIKTVQTNHGLLPEIGLLSHFKADKFITVNKNTFNYLVKEMKINPDKIELIYCGIPVPLNVSKRKTPLEVIFASRLIPEKGADIFIKSIIEIQEQITVKLKIIIAGEGEQESEIKELIKDIKFSVDFLGRVEDLSKVFEHTNICVFPSWSESEGFPSVLTEAAITKNLIISSDFISLYEIFSTEEAVMVRKKDISDLSEKLLEVLNNFEKYEQMIEKSYCKVVSLFDAYKNFSRMTSIYKEILSAN